MDTPEIKLYELLQRHNFNQADAEAFVSGVKDLHTDHLATKSDLANAEKRIVNTLTIRIVVAFVAYALTQYFTNLF